MGISVTTPSRGAAYIKAHSNTAQADRKSDAPAHTQDEVVISSRVQGRDSAACVDAVSEDQVNDTKATTFPTFADEFSKITQGYADTIRNYYAAEHEENLTYGSPSTHIWDKYKNPDSRPRWPPRQCRQIKRAGSRSVSLYKTSLRRMGSSFRQERLSG